MKLHSKGGAALLLLFAILLIWGINNGKIQKAWADLFGGTNAPIAKPSTGKSGSSGANTTETTGSGGGGNGQL